MAINYAWDVSLVDTYPTKDGNANVVYNVHWKLKATDDTNNDSNGNPQTFQLSGLETLDTDSISNFIAFDSLDAAKVQSWVEAAMGSSVVTVHKENLDAKIAEKVTPTSVRKRLVG